MSNSSSRTPSTSSSPDRGGPTAKKRKASSITSISDNQTDPEEESPKTFRNYASKTQIPELFEENVLAKIIRVASRSMRESSVFSQINGVPLSYPETVPQSGPNAGLYEFRDPEFWTCGFFPGSLYALLERSVKHPQSIEVGSDFSTIGVRELRAQLRSLCKSWSRSLHSMAFRTDTHDIGFIVMPALRREWELTGNEQSLRSIIQAARSLATRYVASSGAIRSWDCLVKKEITVTDQTENSLIIIDSLCNLDLLYYAAAHAGDDSLAKVATNHARTLLTTHLRPENGIVVPNSGYQGQLYSTCHVANIEPATGKLKWRWTAQGYANESTWARGQAWAILGYAQTYMWTKDTTFLDAACGVAEYFLHRLDTSPACVEIERDATFTSTSTAQTPFQLPGTQKSTKGRHVPLWDFDAPIENPSDPLRDSSAGVIAANGLLILSQALIALGQDSLSRRFLAAAIDIVRDTVDLCLATEKAQFIGGGGTGGEVADLRVEDTEVGETFDSILKNGTANNNVGARRRYANHGLVYGDYYLIEFGNRLLDLGLV
ncbi:Six-hairpin glycosidase-like protein [Aspergillus keveii]|uniref:Six-hairpin glycosidase-like protein n=1 Tax=Aspergillus keveii TaxID=714993 RepID=A0ABR4FLR4_9EURO